MNGKLTDALAHPLAAVSVIGSAVLATVPGLEPLWAFLGSTAGTWFPLASVLGGVVLPEFGFARIGSQLLIVGGVVYVGIYADRLVDALLERLRDS